MTRTISVEVVVPSRGTPPRIGDRYTWDRKRSLSKFSRFRTGLTGDT